MSECRRVVVTGMGVVSPVGSDVQTAWENLTAGYNGIGPITFTAVVACIGNIGPGLEQVGPMGNFADFSPLSKVVLSMCMIIGRLEIFPILVLFSKSAWQRV